MIKKGHKQTDMEIQWGYAERRWKTCETAKLEKEETEWKNLWADFVVVFYFATSNNVWKTFYWRQVL